MMNKITFNDNNGTFTIKNPENYGALYFPLAGENGIKSSITPNLGGDSKVDQNHFLLEPVSVENLHNNKSSRNFWCKVNGKGYWSATGVSAEQEYKKFTDSQDESELEAGFMWHKLTRVSKEYGLQSEITTFADLNGEVEISLVQITNISDEDIVMTPMTAIPLYGRSADNIRDHRHVTSLLHRTKVVDNGVIVRPVLSFDERGHQENDTSYFVCAASGNGEKPVECYPTVEQFIGEGGSFLNPQAVREDISGKTSGYSVDGKESVGALKFKEVILKAGQTESYIVLLGCVTDDNYIVKIEELTKKYDTEKKVVAELEKVKKHWTEKVNVSFNTGDKTRDNYYKWICFQPVLRRIFGCSFLPYHDYGKGGRGWRDLWQDCLALLIMEPVVVKKMITDNYGGVRIDGTNATIIGSRQGEFIADRNNITRVWMDHAFWPFVTTKLYIDQTGDMDILFEKVPYFKDLQSKRGTDHDAEWSASYGSRQKTKNDEVYYGSVLEHILLQNLCAFYEVGEHNEILLRGADWNDALDMAADRGESVAFTCAYAGNLKDIADMLRKVMAKRGYNKVEVAQEMRILFEKGENLYEDIHRKREILSAYASSCEHDISGNTVILSIEDICANLEEKADWLMAHIRKNEWISAGEDSGWFNGYYDNHGQPVECNTKDSVRMMLTGQVFAIMSGTATPAQIQSICKSADTHLYNAKIGGYRLNTDFKEEKFDLGRMFGFAYGEKENGAVFSHMAVMYGNALYKRGFAEEGDKVLRSLLDTAMNFEVSRMYPGLPEYFDGEGKGLYAYLTGAASWYMLTLINEVFGVKGDMGDLVIKPAMMPYLFDENHNAAIDLTFDGKEFHIVYHNPKEVMCGTIPIVDAVCDNISLPVHEDCIRISKEQIEHLSCDKVHNIEVRLS